MYCEILFHGWSEQKEFDNKKGFATDIAQYFDTGEGIDIQYGGENPKKKRFISN